MFQRCGPPVRLALGTRGSAGSGGVLDVFINCIPFRLVMTATVKLMAQRTRTQLSKDEAGRKDSTKLGLDPDLGSVTRTPHLNRRWLERGRQRQKGELQRTLTNTLSYAFEDVNLMSSPLYTQRSRVWPLQEQKAPNNSTNRDKVRH